MNERAIPLLFNAVLMGIALYGAARLWKETRGVHGASLLSVLILDQALYFLVYVTPSFSLYTRVEKTLILIAGESSAAARTSSRGSKRPVRSRSSSMC